MMKIEHIGIAVRSLSEAVKVYEQAIGLKVAGYDEIDEQGVRVAMLDIGESHIELLEPTRPDSPSCPAWCATTRSPRAQSFTPSASRLLRPATNTSIPPDTKPALARAASARRWDCESASRRR